MSNALLMERATESELTRVLKRNSLDETVRFDNIPRQLRYQQRLKRHDISVGPSSEVNAKIHGTEFLNGGLNFSIPASKNIGEMSIALYRNENSKVPYAVIPFTEADRIESAGHDTFVKRLVGNGVKSGLCYNLVVDGAVALDPGSQGVGGTITWQKPENFYHHHTPETPNPQDHIDLDQVMHHNSEREQPFTAAKSVALELPARVPDHEHVYVAPENKFVYEFTPCSTSQNPNVPAEDRGLLSSIVSPELISHLKSIHVTTIKLPPLHFSIDEGFLKEFGQNGENVFGYNTAHLNGLNPKLFKSTTAAGRIEEARAIIAYLHKEGFEVIEDVVVAHTCEASPGEGPGVGMRLVGPELYFRIDDQGRYANPSACGNAIDSNSEIARKLIVARAHFGKHILGLDGARYDQANILMRGEDLEFETDHQLMDELVAIYGPGQVLCETSDNCNFVEPHIKTVLPTLEHGKFPDTTIEIAFGGRTTIQSAVWGMKHLEDKLLQDHLMDISTGNHPGLAFTACQDGARLVDVISRELPKLRSRFPNMPGSDDEILFACLRGLEAWGTWLAKGAIKAGVGSEVARSQGDNDDAWKNKELLQYDTSPTDTRRRNFLLSYREGMHLRQEHAHLIKRSLNYTESESLTFNASGNQVAKLNTEDVIFGHLVKAPGEGLNVGAIFKVFAMEPGTIKLPDAPKGMYWERKLDTQLNNALDQYKKTEIHSSYTFNVCLSTALFELKEKPSIAQAA